MNRGRRNTTGSRRSNNHAGQGARPDPGRGSIVPSSAREQRRRGDGQARGPEVGRSLVDRITFDNGARGGRGGARVGRALADRVSFDDSGGGGGPSHPAAARVAARNGGHGNMGVRGVGHHRDRGNTGAPGAGQGVHTIGRGNMGAGGGPPSTRPRAGADQDPSAVVTEQAQDRRQSNSGEPTSRVSRAAPKLNARSSRVSKSKKSTLHRLVSNANLRALLGGTNKPRAPKRQDQMLLRMGERASGVEGYELVANSPFHE